MTRIIKIACLLLATAAASHAATIYVDAAAAGGGDGSLPTPFNNLTTAIDAAATSDTVLVAGGTYSVTGGSLNASNLNIDNNEMTVEGGYNSTFTARDKAGNPTVVDWENGSGNRMIVTSNTKGVTIDGIDNINNASDTSWGGTGEVQGGGEATYIDCKFVNNTGSRGGALAIQGDNAAPSELVQFIGCTFSGNTTRDRDGGAVWTRNGASVHFIDCLLEDNATSASGTKGGVILWGGGNTDDGPSFLFDRCIIRNNRSAQAGSIWELPNAAISTTITNCLIYGNVGDPTDSHWGNGENPGGNVLIAHCTFYNNTWGNLDQGGGADVNAFRFEYASPTIKNSIFVGNNAAKFFSGTAGTVENCVFGDNFRDTAKSITGGIGDWGTDPATDSNTTDTVPTCFADAAGGDFSPTSLSSALGIGEDLGLTMDVYGNPRPLPAGTAPEAGAVETMFVPVELSVFELN